MLDRMTQIIVILSILCPTIMAQNSTPKGYPEMVTDRPDLTESSSVVPRSSVQFEMGWSIARSTVGKEKETSNQIPATLVRLGLMDRLELRLGWNGGQWQTITSGLNSLTNKGVGDFNIGTKIALWDKEGSRPQAAIIIGTSVPSGNKLFTSHRTDPAVILAMSNDLSERVSIGWNLGSTWNTNKETDEDLDTYPRGVYTVALGISASQRTGIFLEYFGSTALNGSSRASNNFDGGLTYLICRNVQIDTSVGVGLSSESPDWFVGTGISFRLPH